jgi:hypothetical protein
MFGRKKRPQFDAGAFDSVLDGAKSLYFGKVRPLEEQCLVDQFHYPLLNPADLDAKPMVMLIGQYSTGKTTFIRYLLERDFPGMHVGPQPTTDKWQAIMHGETERELPGNALASNPGQPFYALSKQFGNAFLSKFCGCEVPSQFSRGCTLIDTPGILAGKKQVGLLPLLSAGPSAGFPLSQSRTPKCHSQAGRSGRASQLCPPPGILSDGGPALLVRERADVVRASGGLDSPDVRSAQGEHGVCKG